MKQSFHFPHDYNSKSDVNIVRMRREMGWESYGLYWAIIEKSGEEGSFGRLECADIEDIAWELRTETDKLLKIIGAYGLFMKSKDKKYFWSKRFVAHLKKRQEIAEIRKELGRRGGEANAKQKVSKSLSKTEAKAQAKSSKEKESKVKEKKEKESNTGAPKIHRIINFNIFWENYPNKKAKQNAEASWNKIALGDHQKIMAGLENYKKSEQWLKDGGRFIPHPATFLNQRRWEDKIEVEVDGDAAAREEQIKTRADQYFRATNKYASDEQRNAWREKLKNGENIF